MGRRGVVAVAVRGVMAVIVLSAGLGAGASPTSAASEDGSARAVLDGLPIAIGDISRYHCHDRAFPLIRCFHDSASRDLDEQTAPALKQSAGLSGTVTPYVRWYADGGLLGPSFSASIPYANLGDVGWNDAISSFSTYPGGHPRWSQDIGSGGTHWDWGFASVTYVGDAANDKFSSVERL